MPHDFEIEAENPYDEEATFNITVIESNCRNGYIKNPFNPKQGEESNSLSDFKLPTIDKKHGTRFKQSSKSSFESQRLVKLKEAEKKEDDSKELKAFYSAFSSRDTTIHLEAKEKKKIVLTYLPLQLLKHSCAILFSNEKLGEFLYNVEGTAQLPEPAKIAIDEKSLDPARVKLIKSSRINDNNLTFRCFAGDKVEIKLLLPVCNRQREDAIVMATEMVIF